MEEAKKLRDETSVKTARLDGQGTQRAARTPLQEEVLVGGREVSGDFFDQLETVGSVQHDDIVNIQSPVNTDLSRKYVMSQKEARIKDLGLDEILSRKETPEAPVQHIQRDRYVNNKVDDFIENQIVRKPSTRFILEEFKNQLEYLKKSPTEVNIKRDDIISRGRNAIEMFSDGLIARSVRRIYTREPGPSSRESETRYPASSNNILSDNERKTGFRIEQMYPTEEDKYSYKHSNQITQNTFYNNRQTTDRLSRQSSRNEDIKYTTFNTNNNFFQKTASDNPFYKIERQERLLNQEKKDENIGLDVLEYNIRPKLTSFP